MPNIVIKVYITEYNDGLFEHGITQTPFPESPTQMADIYTFLKGIYDEFRRRELYESSILLYMRNTRVVGDETLESGYDYAEDTPEDHLFRDGPLPGEYTFRILEDDIHNGRVRRGHTVFLTDVCEGSNIHNQWVLFLEIV